MSTLREHNHKFTLYIFIDGFGWELYKNNKWFMEEIIVDAVPAESVLGYSSACIPSILTGEYPEKHGHWNGFFADKTPFDVTKKFNALFDIMGLSKRFRRYLTAYLKKCYSINGYFELYNIPLSKLKYFDYCEKKNIFTADSLGEAETVFSKLKNNNISYISVTEGTDSEKIDEVERLIESIPDIPKVIYLHLNQLDSVLHLYPKDGKEVKDVLDFYHAKITSLFLDIQRKLYGDVAIRIFSDHGMCRINKLVDVMKKIKSTQWKYGTDFIYFFDSTMARFWYMNNKCKKEIINIMAGVEEGRFLTQVEKEHYGIDFPGHKYGEDIFLLEPGAMFAPSFMGRRGIFGMHGFSPEDKDSSAIFLSNHEIIKRKRKIMDVFFGGH